ncbi:MAG: glutamine--fructose-6-phosphate transaminase (isomerizing) [Deltaproteobacteria bacterium]|nr:glutamine--fructose-6-phosphate transaminase (isomerizing) [Deltaproteobacteria bacterium]
MCGIVGYIGDRKKTVQVLMDGLSRLEYRGYDSSGIAVMQDGRSRVFKSKGKLNNLRNRIRGNSLSGNLGIGHTRWATHGKPNKRNAHPHVSGSVSIVHNGIIENYNELKKELIKKGYEFYSETDTEAVAHLIEDLSDSNLPFEDAVRSAFKRVEGSYAVAVISERAPDKIIGIRKFSPLIIAIGEEENFLASDVQAVLPYSNKIIFLEDGDVAILEKSGFKITDLDGNGVERNVSTINWDPVAIGKCGYRHFMLKEIHEQSRAVLDTLRGRTFEETGAVTFEGLDEDFFKNIRRIIALGCGTSYHACLTGKYMIENLSNIHVEVDLSSEFRYREPVLDHNTLAIAVSQSGETADTSEALLEARRRGAKTLAITNVERSKIARESNFVIYTHAGPEIGVASTKAFTTQLIVMYLLSILLGRVRKKINEKAGRELIKEALAVPQLIEKTLKREGEIQELAKGFYGYNNFLYLGRGPNYPIALEGALKLKEITYIHAEGFAAGEMKHGPIALVDENVPVVFIAPRYGIFYKKILGNLEEIRARKGKVIFLTNGAGQEEISKHVDEIITIPECSTHISPLISVIPLQLLAYYIATYKGTDIDQPRNLAKVVTVE